MEFVEFGEADDVACMANIESSFEFEDAVVIGEITEP
jgi:hypothetical protein